MTTWRGRPRRAASWCRRPRRRRCTCPRPSGAARATAWSSSNWRVTEGALVRHWSATTPRATWLRAVALVTLTTFVTTSCGGRGSGTPAHLGSASPISDQVLIQTKDLPDGIDLRLSNGQQGAPAFDHSKLAPAKKLGEADAAAILKRARPIASDSDDAQSFALRP